jgi:hypothetical protein
LSHCGCRLAWTFLARRGTAMAKARSKAQLESTAYHEAGHAVAAWALEYRVSVVTIKPRDDGSHGHVRWTNPLRRRNVVAALEGIATEREVDRARPYIEHAIIASLAGSVAQRRHNPRSHWRSGASGAKRGELIARDTDYDLVIDLIYRLYGGRQKVMDTYWSYLEALAEALIDFHWERIERLAAALLNRETLKDQEIIDAIVGPELVEVRRQMLKQAQENRGPALTSGPAR